MSRAICECPNCSGVFPVMWDWYEVRAACLRDEYGEVVSDCDLLDATRVVYQRHVVCPHCGMPLHVEHELVPRFHAFEEASDADGAR